MPLGPLIEGRGQAVRLITNMALDRSSIGAALFAKVEFLSSGSTWDVKKY